MTRLRLIMAALLAAVCIATAVSFVARAQGDIPYGPQVKARQLGGGTIYVAKCERGLIEEQIQQVVAEMRDQECKQITLTWLYSNIWYARGEWVYYTEPNGGLRNETK